MPCRGAINKAVATVAGTFLAAVASAFMVLPAHAATLYDAGDGVATTTQCAGSSPCTGAQADQSGFGGAGSAKYARFRVTCPTSGTVTGGNVSDGTHNWILDAGQSCTSGTTCVLHFTATTAIDLSTLGSFIFLNGGVNAGGGGTCTDNIVLSDTITGHFRGSTVDFTGDDLPVGFADATDFDGTDHRASPTVTVYDPPEGTTLTLDQANAAGGYTFRATTDVSADTFPGETLEMDFALYKGVDLVAVHQHVPATLIYGTSHFYAGEAVFPSFVYTTGTYTVRASAHFFSQAGYGPYSSGANGDFIVATSVPAPVCSGTASIFDPCWIHNLLSFIFLPSSDATGTLFATLSGFSAKWPISWFTDTFSASVGAFGTATADLGTPNSVNPLAGTYPNTAWYAQQLSSLYGSWASPACVAAVWLAAVYAIVSAGARLLNIDLNEPDV